MKVRSGKARVSAIVWGLFLWVGVPIGLFAAGYKLVGPRIGEDPTLKNSVESLIANKGGKEVEPDKPEPDEVQVDDTKGPAVEVTVEKSNGRSKRSEEATAQKPKSKKKKKPAPRIDPEVNGDPASGATTGGDRSTDPAGGG